MGSIMAPNTIQVIPGLPFGLGHLLSTPNSNARLGASCDMHHILRNLSPHPFTGRFQRETWHSSTEYQGLRDWEFDLPFRFPCSFFKHRLGIRVLAAQGESESLERLGV